MGMLKCLVCGGLQESNTPLHLAAFHGNLEGVKAMVEVR
jgi:hypothetical protein